MAIGIIGIGDTAYKPETDSTLEEVIFDGVSAALDDAGIEREDLDHVVACASDLEDGRSISSMVGATPAGSFRKPFIKATDTGIHALGLAMMRMEAGLADTTLVVSWSKASEAEIEKVSNLEGDPFYHRDTGLSGTSAHGVQAAAYLEDNPEAEAAANDAVERYSRRASDHPRIEGRDTVTAEEAAASEYVSSPLREAHVPPHFDGATALVIGSEERAAAADSPVWIDGIGWETGAYNMGARPMGRFPALGDAAASAFEEADVGTPLDALDVLELDEKTAFHEFMTLESLGLGTDGVALSEDLREGGPAINPSGGTLGADPLTASGLVRVAETARQVRGTADGYQVEGAEVGLAHATGGFDQAHGVAVLRGEHA